MSYIIILLYLIATILLILRLNYRNHPIFLSQQIAVLMIIVACFCHSYQLYSVLITEDGINFGFFHVFSLASLFTLVIFTLLLIRHEIINLAIVILPISALAVVLSANINMNHFILMHNMAMKIHIIIAFSAHSVLSLASAQALLLALQDYYLRRKRPGGFIRLLPALESMENMLFDLIVIGFILLSLTLFSGFIFIDNIGQQHLAHKIFFSMSAWCIYGILLWGRKNYGWRGKTAIKWSLFGVILLMLSYFGSKLVLEVILGIH